VAAQEGHGHVTAPLLPLAWSHSGLGLHADCRGGLITVQGASPFMSGTNTSLQSGAVLVLVQLDMAAARLSTDVSCTYFTSCTSMCLFAPFL
jgi:hypothetical protein